MRKTICHFPCPSACPVPQCAHTLVYGEEQVGFPFELDEKIGSGGFASVYKGVFHDDHAAFKFIPLDEKQLTNHYTHPFHHSLNAGGSEYVEQLRTSIRMCFHVYF